MVHALNARAWYDDTLVGVILTSEVHPLNRKAILILGCLAFSPVSARCQGEPKAAVSQEQKIDAGMANLLQADKPSLEQTLGRSIENKDLRGEIAAILGFFRSRDSELKEKSAKGGTEDAGRTSFSLSASFASLDSSTAAQALRGLRLKAHAAMQAAAKKYGLDACPFGDKKIAKK